MLLIKIFVELRVVAIRSRRRAGSPQAVSRRPCSAVALRITAWSEHDMGPAWAWHGMANMNHTRPHCVNQMGKTHSKHLSGTVWQGNGMGAAWARHVHGKLCVNRPLGWQESSRNTATVQFMLATM